MVQNEWQKTGFRSFEDSLVKLYASKNGKIYIKISETFSKSFRSFFDDYIQAFLS